MNYDKSLKELISLAVFSLIISLDSAYAEWQIDISSFQRDLCNTASYDPRLCNSPSRIGNFKTKEECERARYEASFGGGRNDSFFYNRSFCVGFDSSQKEVPQYQQRQRAKGHIDLSLLMITKCKDKKTYDPPICEKTYLVGNYNTKEECEQDRIRVFSARKDYYEATSCTNQAFDPQHADVMKRALHGSLVYEDYLSQFEQASKIKQENFIKENTRFYNKLGRKFLEEKNLREYISTLKQLANAAEYSLRALKFALAGDFEMAGMLSSCQFDNLDKPCPLKPEKTIVVYVPSPITPVLESSQAKIYHYIKERSNKYLAEITENQQKMQEIKNALDKIESKRTEIKEKKAEIEEKIKETNLKEQKEELNLKKAELEREEDPILLQAQKLRKTAMEFNRRAEEIRQGLGKLENLFDQVSSDPEKADELYPKIIVTNKYV